MRFGRWIARPSATSPASLIASDSVGCGAIPSATVSTVDSASIATTPASIRSVACGPDDHEPEQLAVARLVDRLHPADGLVLHHRARVRDPREAADGDVVAVLLARLGLGEADAGDLGIGVDRPRHGRSPIDGVVAAARSRPRPRPRGTRCGRAASSRRSRRPRRCAATDVRRWSSVADPLARVEGDAGRLEADARRRAAPGRPRRASGRPRPTRRRRSAPSSASAASARRRCTACRAASAIPCLPNAFASSFEASSSSCGISAVEHLDDRHLAAEACGRSRRTRSR